MAMLLIALAPLSCRQEAMHRMWQNFYQVARQFLSIVHCLGKLSSRKIMRIFKADSFLKTFIKVKKYHAQIILKIRIGCRVSTAKIYLHNSSKIFKARPHIVEWREYTSRDVRSGTSVQSSGPCLNYEKMILKIRIGCRVSTAKIYVLT